MRSYTATEHEVKEALLEFQGCGECSGMLGSFTQNLTSSVLHLALNRKYPRSTVPGLHEANMDTPDLSLDWVFLFPELSKPSSLDNAPTNHCYGYNFDD